MHKRQSLDLDPAAERLCLVVLLEETQALVCEQAELLPGADERQRRARQQLLELMSAQDLPVEVGLPDPGARPGAVQQGGLARQQPPVLREEAGAVLAVTLLIPNTPELLPEEQRQNS